MILKLTGKPKPDANHLLNKTKNSYLGMSCDDHVRRKRHRELGCQPAKILKGHLLKDSKKRKGLGNAHGNCESKINNKKIKDLPSKI